MRPRRTGVGVRKGVSHLTGEIIENLRLGEGVVSTRPRLETGLF